MTKFIQIENFKHRVLISPDLDEYRAHIQRFIDLGSDEAYGKHVVPSLQWEQAQTSA